LPSEKEYFETLVYPLSFSKQAAGDLEMMLCILFFNSWESDGADWLHYFHRETYLESGDL
jgi:hypothetical protein